MNWRHFVYMLYQATRASYLAQEKNSALGLVWHLLNPLLRLIAGLYRPTSGTVRVEGPVCCFLEPGAGAAPSLPVRDNVFLYASLAGLGYRETAEVLGVYRNE